MPIGGDGVTEPCYEVRRDSLAFVEDFNKKGSGGERISLGSRLFALRLTVELFRSLTIRKHIKLCRKR